MKELLMTLIDTLGLTVETTLDFKPRKEGLPRLLPEDFERVLDADLETYELLRDSDGDYISVLSKPVVSYVLKPKV